MITFLIGLTSRLADLTSLLAGHGPQFSAITDEYLWSTAEYDLPYTAAGHGQWTVIARQMALILGKGQNAPDKYSNSDDRVRI